MLMPDPHRTQHDRYLDNYRRTGQRNIIGNGRAVEGLRKDGSLVPLELSIAEWIDGSGHKNFTGILHDITLHREQEINLQKAIEAAQAANRAKTDFLAVMSHEIRTPLTSINGFVDVLSGTPRLSRDQRRYIEPVQTASSALLTIVNNILDFSKVEAGQMELEQRSFSPMTLIHDTLAIVPRLPDQAGLHHRQGTTDHPLGA
jgi:signal transduction histidine kinase